MEKYLLVFEQNIGSFIADVTTVFNFISYLLILYSFLIIICNLVFPRWILDYIGIFFHHTLFSVFVISVAASTLSCFIYLIGPRNYDKDIQHISLQDSKNIAKGEITIIRYASIISALLLITGEITREITVWVINEQNYIFRLLLRLITLGYTLLEWIKSFFDTDPEPLALPNRVQTTLIQDADPESVALPQRVQTTLIQDADPEPVALPQRVQTTLIQGKDEKDTLEQQKRYNVSDSKEFSVTTKPSQYAAIVAVDFGTTYSGYAYALMKDIDMEKGIQNVNEIHMNHNWGDYLGFLYHKTPTCICLDSGGNILSFGFEAQTKYMEDEENYDNVDDILERNEHETDDFVDENRRQLYQKFKMQLYKQQHSTANKLTSDYGQDADPLDVFAKSLHYLKEHAVNVLMKSKSISTQDDILWVITVPAIWEEREKLFMRQAAVKAGFIDHISSEKLKIALEPEAAALFCQKSTQRFMHPGSKYMVVDAGGGTVDITTHEVDDKGNLKEIIKPTGGNWGGENVNIEFDRLLCSILGKDFINHCKAKEPVIFYELMRHFEQAKRGWSHNSTKPMMLDITHAFAEEYKRFNPSGLHKAFKTFNDSNITMTKKSRLKLAPDKVKELFDPVIDKIIAHITGILKAANKEDLTIYLVGGFCESKYLQDRIEENVPNYCEVVIPTEPSLSVVKGAVLYGMNTRSIASRIAPKTYSVKLKGNEDHDNFKIRGPDDTQETILKKGQEIKADFKKTVQARRNDSKKVEIDLCSSEDDDLHKKICSIQLDCNDTLEDKTMLLDFHYDTELSMSAFDSIGGKIEPVINLAAPKPTMEEMEEYCSILQENMTETDDLLGFYVSKNCTNIILDIVEGSETLVLSLLKEKCSSLLEHDIIKFTPQKTKPEYLHNDWKRIIVKDQSSQPEGASSNSSNTSGTIACFIELPSEEGVKIYAMTAQHVVKKGLGKMEGDGCFCTDSIINDDRRKIEMTISEKYFGVMGGLNRKSKAVDVSMLPIEKAIAEFALERYNVRRVNLNIFKGSYKDLSSLYFQGGTTSSGHGLLRQDNYFATYEDENNKKWYNGGALVVVPDPKGKTIRFATKGDSGSLVQTNPKTAVGIVSKIHYDYIDEDGMKVDANLVCRMEECVKAMNEGHNLNINPDNLDVFFVEEVKTD